MIVKYCSILFVALALAACGVKRDLTLPEKEKPAAAQSIDNE